MTKLFSLMMVGAFALGCGGGKKENTTTTDMTNTTDTTDTTDTPQAGAGTPCEQEIALECPEGQIDACLKTPPEGDTHTCVDQ
jgi:hypothetical protein